jgi:hypothetical protein
MNVLGRANSSSSSDGAGEALVPLPIALKTSNDQTACRRVECNLFSLGAGAMTVRFCAP